MNITDILTDITKRFVCRPGVWARTCNSGELYVVIGTAEAGSRAPAALPGTVPEGWRYKVWGSEEEACTRFLEAFNRYAEAVEMLRKPGNEPTILWWRYEAPHIFMEYGSPNGKHWALDRPRFPTICRVRCRLCISSKPIVYETQEDYDAANSAVFLEGNANGDQRPPTVTT